MTWVRAHYQALIALAGALWTLLSIINGMLTNPEAKSFLGKILDALSYIVRQGAQGSVKVPLVQRSRAPGKLAVPSAPPSAPAALLPLLLISTLVLNGCGFGACMLGKLKQQYQTIIEEVTADLASADYVALLAQLGVTAGTDAVTCTVQAVVAYEQSKQQKPPVGARLKLEPNVILDHGQIWLNSHKPVACAERHAS